MAFNPFTSFRKHQKVWMATVLLLCMVTFVLCTGVGGDLSERLLNFFRPRSGSVMAELDGRTIYSDDLQRIKDQRKMAEKFVRMAMEVVITRINDNLTQDEAAAGKTAKTQRENIRKRLGGVEAELKARLAKPRYFEGDLKLESLVDFMLWLKQADRLEINLTAESVNEMFYREVIAVVPTGGDGRVPLFAPQDESRILYDMRRDFPGITGANVAQALMDEYRVRIAQLAAFQAQGQRFRDGLRATDKNVLREMQLLKPRYPEEVRAPLSPAQMWDIYKQKRTPYDVALVPVRVDRFRDKIKDPDADKLKSYFEAHKTQPYDPTSPKPGFEIAQMVKAAWIMADPASPAYEKPAQLVSLLEITPPVPVIGPFDALASAVRLGASPLAFDASMERNYESARRRRLDPRLSVNIQDILDADPSAKYLIASLTEPAGPALLSYLLKPTAAGVASSVGVAAADPLAALAPYRVDGAAGVQAEVDRLVAEENKPRVQLAAAMVSLAATSPFAAPAVWLDADRGTRFLPLAAVKKEFQERYEAQLARTWTAANMALVKEKLDPLAGKDRALEIWIPKLVAQYGLRHGATDKFYDRFEIGSAPELAPLREGFEKDREFINIQLGTAGTPEMLHEGDFHKLFFGTSDSSSGRYVIRPWPPILDIKENPSRGQAARKVSMFEQSGKPILFWKTDEKFARAADKLDEVLSRVLETWKTEKAREELALPRAKEIAQALLKSGGDFAPAVRAEAKKLDVTPVIVRGLTVLHPDRGGDLQGFGQNRAYREFPLPKELNVDADNAKLYPREDMVKQLLALTRPEKPIQSDFKTLDDLNKELFEVIKKLPETERARKFVQVLTNKPHTMFWVAAVVGMPGADMRDFAEAYKKAADFPRDAFIALAQEDAARQYQDALLQQLRRDMGYKIRADEAARKSFDTSD